MIQFSLYVILNLFTGFSGAVKFYLQLLITEPNRTGKASRFTLLQFLWCRHLNVVEQLKHTWLGEKPNNAFRELIISLLKEMSINVQMNTTLISTELSSPCIDTWCYLTCLRDVCNMFHGVDRSYTASIGDHSLCDAVWRQDKMHESTLNRFKMLECGQLN